MQSLQSQTSIQGLRPWPVVIRGVGALVCAASTWVGTARAVDWDRGTMRFAATACVAAVLGATPDALAGYGGLGATVWLHVALAAGAAATGFSVARLRAHAAQRASGPPA